MSIPQLRPSPSLLSLHDAYSSHSHHGHHSPNHLPSSSAFTSLPKVFFYSSTLLALNHSQHVGIDVMVLVGGIWLVAATGVIRRTSGRKAESINVSSKAVFLIASRYSARD